MRNKNIVVVILLSSIFILAGCSGQNTNTSNNNLTNETGNRSEVTSDPRETIETNGADHSSDSGIVEINEKIFIAQTNEIYINIDDYLDKTVKYEGIFLTSTDSATGSDYYYVLRYGPGCCGYDGTAGFEVVWPEGIQIPQENDWCEVIGTPEIYEDGGMRYVRMNVSSLTVMEERGEEYVSQ